MLMVAVDGHYIEDLNTVEVKTEINHLKHEALVLQTFRLSQQEDKIRERTKRELSFQIPDKIILRINKIKE